MIYAWQKVKGEWEKYVLRSFIKFIILLVGLSKVAYIKVCMISWLCNKNFFDGGKSIPATCAGVSVSPSSPETDILP